MKRQRGMGLFALCAVLSVAACSLDDFIEYGGVIGLDDGASEGTAQALRVDGSRDERVVLNTGAAIDLPKGAVSAPVEIGMERPADLDAVDLVKPLKDYQAIVSFPYVLTPHGTKFREPVTIEIPVVKQTDKKLVMAYLENEDDKTWKKLGDPVVKDGVAKLAIDHFSVVIVLEEERANLSEPGAGSGPSGNDAGAPSSADLPGAVDAGSIPFVPDASRFPSAPDAGFVGTPYDAGLPFFDKDASFWPPFVDASPVYDAGVITFWPPDAAPSANDAAIPPFNDAGFPVVDAAAKDAGVPDAAGG